MPTLGRMGGVAALVVLPALAHAQERISGMTRSGLLSSQLSVLDGRAADQYDDSVRLQPPRAEVPALPGAAVYTGPTTSPWFETARDAARRHGIPEDLFLRLVRQESGWNPGAISSKGAIGLAQLMPGTADLLGVDPHDPAANLDGGARYLRRQFDRFGSWPLALAAYNAGPEAVEQHGGIPPFAETTSYVAVITGG